MKLFLGFFVAILLFSGKAAGSNTCSEPRTGADTAWADSVLRSLTVEQRIAQLMMIRAFSWKDSVYDDSLSKVIRFWNIGGVCFFKGTPYHQSVLTNRWQKTAQTPLLVAIDAECGLGMRLDSAFTFPKQMTLGAIRNDSLIYRMGEAIGRDCRRCGVHINFAPVADINNNPANPIIGTRSFGEDRKDVAMKCLAYMNGLKSKGVFATAKHFPGHGNTDTDSHLSLPVIRQSREMLDSTELYPFRQLIKNGVRGIMVAHLYVPAYDSTANVASTLSANVIDTLLKQKMGFGGWVISDALDMKGVTKYFKPGEIELRALEAGNDILLLPQDAGLSIMAIKQRCDSSQALTELVDRECRKLLLLKYRCGLAKLKPIRLTNLYGDINPVISSVLNENLYRAAITVVKDDDRMIPMTLLDRRKIAVLSVGDSTLTSFQEMLGRYSPVTFFNLPPDFSRSMMDSIITQLHNFDLVIAGIHCRTNLASENFGFPQLASYLIDSLSSFTRVILDIFGTPYSLSLLKNPAEISGVIVSYQNTPEAEKASAQVIFGGTVASGKLPVTGSPVFPLHTGIVTERSRMEFCPPEDLCISRDKLRVIDSLAMLGIEKKAYPGCQILFTKDGKIFYQKSFGHPRYEDSVMVRNDDIYDMASLTKVLATTLAVMKLYEQGKISPDGTLGSYLPEAKGTDKQNLTIRDIMMHQAGLQPWIKFYEQTLLNGNPDPGIYSTTQTPGFPVRVATGLYIRKGYEDTIYKEILRSPLRISRDYKYSDLGFYLLRKVVERLSGKPFEEYLTTEFYRPLGLTTMGFNPLNRFPAERIMPTENDTEFRKQQIRGDVHDPGAAMLGGVSGHAGLFSDAADVAVILQLLLNDGNYGGKQYLLPSTIHEFTRSQFSGKGNRRALGFDKPTATYIPDGPSCRSVSTESYGHSGFTGTYFWADPANNLIYVFLSNRVYPDAANQKLSGMNLRTRIHQAMYDILGQENK
jgi:beta-N-acetylhexosaminidase